MSEQLKCKECGGTLLTWSLSLRHTTNIAGHNRLGLHNVAVDAVLGCEDCSATLKVVDGQKMVDEMVTTSARLESALAAERADCARAKESLDERCKTIIEQRTRIDFLDPYCKRLEEELAAEREKVAAMTDRVRGLEGALRQISELGIFQTTSAAIDIARAALTPPAPQQENADVL